MDPRVLIFVSLGCFLLGYFIWQILQYSQKNAHKRDDRPYLSFFPVLALTLPKWLIGSIKIFKPFILIFLALMSLSPVLRTLSAATSSDSIWALSACLFLLNILLADYGSSSPVNRVPER